VIQIFYFI